MNRILTICAAVCLTAGLSHGQPSFTISTVAGTGIAGFSGDSGPATGADLRFPAAIWKTASGNLYIADSINHRVRLVAPDGTIRTVAGDGESGYRGDDASATAARISSAYGVAADSAGNIYIADTLNSVVRRVSSTGTITTFAGTGLRGFSGDGGPARDALLSNPTGLALDAAGNLYIADTGNSRIRKIGTDGRISTVAGSFTESFGGDGHPATEASLNRPAAVAVDAAGNLYIADTVNHRVRKVGSDGIIQTIAGSGNTAGFGGDGGPATQAVLSYPARRRRGRLRQRLYR
jgi:sugar lactone lactonase YvrE